ncbi:MAG: phosphatase PAP2 family protein [Clostridia bacterium]|nr:phosphatase PAP2 family protein [Clostridia bacterium]
MAVLKWLESIRMPWLDELMLVLTEMGDETVFMVIAMVILWCCNKAWGYRFMVMGMAGTALNQLLKAIFLVPRPWVLDPSFTIVEAARDAATGYSFPSGHTQSAATCFGGLAAWQKKTGVTIACIAAVLIVGFSRMYLGVHTPMDVGVSLVTGTVTVLLMTWLYNKGGKVTWLVNIGSMLLALALMAYVLFMPARAANVAEFDAHGVKAAWQVVGVTAGVLLAWWLDEKYLHFDTKAVWWAQVCKVVIGLLLVVAVKSGLKPVFTAIFGEAMFAHGIRYFLMTAVGGILWPMSFKWWNKLGRAKTEVSA